MKSKENTSWGEVANWYHDLLVTNPDSYQEKVIKPNLIRLVSPKKDMAVLDLACGEGFFSRAMQAEKATVTGLDISKELIDLAKKNAPKGSTFIVSPADKLETLKDGSFDVVVCVLALQNIENISGTFSEIKRVLKPQGRFIFVLNHPTFRIPKESSWGFDEVKKIEYRRVDKYLSESRVGISMNPSREDSKETISFHRPLQFYFKLLQKNGFVTLRLEEWISHKKSEPGPRMEAENRARKEIPLFLAIEVKSMSPQV